MDSSSPDKKRNPRKVRILAGLGVILVAVAVLLWVGLGRGAVYYYSVSELKALGSAEHVRVSGDLVGDSLVDHNGTSYTFAVSDRDKPADTLTVVFDSALPDAFKNEPGFEIVAEGDYNGSGTFSAASLITKCPSKYEAAP
jgi:cytochrome c-type biogenesis protein CcmE